VNKVGKKDYYDILLYKCTISMEPNMPGLIPIASDKLLFTTFHTPQWAQLFMSVMYKM